MPFNSAMMFGGGATYELAITISDNAILYNVETRVRQKYGISSTQPGDLIILTLAAGFDLVSADVNGYAIDGNDLNDSAKLSIVMDNDTRVIGKGGEGGNGGSFAANGSSGEDGGTALRLGCPTVVSGQGEFAGGGGGGGGGGGDSTMGELGSRVGGGGGGGGAGIGDGGSGGSGSGGSGSSGDDGTQGSGGDGGVGASAEGAFAGDGGNGGNLATEGSAGQGSATTSGGAGGDPGDAVHKQGFSFSIGGSITLTGGNA